MLKKDQSESFLGVFGIQAKTEPDELRFCDYCGEPMEEGFTDENEYLCCEEEFIQRMDSSYGAGNWRAEPSGQAEHCYEYQEEGKWYPLGWYWTQWY